MREKFSSKLERIARIAPIASQGKIWEVVRELQGKNVNSYRALLAALSDSTNSIETKLVICWYLGKLQNSRAVKSLLNVFGTPELTWEVAKALVQIGGKGTVNSLITCLQEEKQVEIRSASAYALGLIGDKQATQPLLKVLSDQNADPRVRGHVAESLAYLVEPYVLDIIESLNCVLNDNSQEVRYWAAFALSQIVDEKHLPSLPNDDCTRREN